MATSSQLYETKLYKRLIELAEETEISIQEQKERKKAIILVNDISEEASELMKITSTYFPEYTLHDETHLLGVTDLMGRILSASESLEGLSYIEITILILAAYLHDIGMAPSKEKIDKIIESQEFILFRETRRRDLENLKEIQLPLEQQGLSISEKLKLRRKEAEIEQSILTEYLRQLHGEIGAEYIKKEWATDKRWTIGSNNIAESVSWVCKGHSLTHNQLISDYHENYPVDKYIGENKVNILYCTLILRLADILDFDQKRTPNVLYRNISPRNNISIHEWNKHKSVNGWEISQEIILFGCECTHPVYEKTLRQFLDYIDNELQNCLLIVKDFPARVADRYKLKLPTTVNRTKITSKNYSYIDLSFSLSHEEIMKLLMGRDFWGGESLCVRELIQNAYDSIRHRKALEKSQGNDWNQGKITLTQRLNADGRVELECKDNGMGMNRHILENYFFKIGKSYYRSPEFEQERNGLKGKNVNFDPISQFGIGIVSCFLIGSSLRIRTQRFLGYYRGCGELLEIDVDGFSRMAYVRVIEGDPSPGTCITVIGKKMTHAEASDEWQDPLNLLSTARFYAAALDTPINVIVESPFEKCDFTIYSPSHPLSLKTYPEISSRIPSEYYVIIQRDFQSMLEDCDGTAKIIFLVDEQGKVCTKNNWGYWVKDDKKANFFSMRCSSGEDVSDLFECRSVLSQDGILISYDDKIRGKLRHHSVAYSSPYQAFPGSYFINLYKSSKLPLKPSRAPYQPMTSLSDSEEEHIWKKFGYRLDSFIGGVMETVLQSDILRPEPEIFWSIIEIYRFSLDNISKKCAYDFLPIPYMQKDSSQLHWNTLKDIVKGGADYIALLPDRVRNANFEEVVVSIPINSLNIELCKDSTIKTQISSLIRAVTVMTVEEGKVLYKIDLNTPKFEKLGESTSIEFEHGYVISPFYYQVYSEELNKYVSVSNPAAGMNCNHPVTKFLINYYIEPRDEYRWFVYGMKIVSQKITHDVDFDEKNPSEWNYETIRLVNLAISHWEKVDWDKIPESIMPPYHIYYPSSGRSHPISLEYLKEKIKGSDYITKEDINYLLSLD